MTFNPTTVVTHFAHDDTHIDAITVADGPAVRVGTVRVVIGTHVELFLTPKAAAELVRQVAEHVDEVFAVIIAPAFTDVDNAPTGEVPPDILTTSDGTGYVIDRVGGA